MHVFVWPAADGGPLIYARGIPFLPKYGIEAAPGNSVAYNLWQNTTGVAEAQIVVELLEHLSTHAAGSERLIRRRDGGRAGMSRWDRVERGHMLETWVFHELRAQVSYGGVGGELSYWQTAAGVEIDFLWSRGKSVVGIEVKSADRWRPDDGKALQTALKEKAAQLYCAPPSSSTKSGAIARLHFASRYAF